MDANLRLIPARAGKTPPLCSSYSRSSAHPRVSGENRLNSTRLRSTPGSSPLTRGKLLPLDLSGLPGGLIPTHAGKTGQVVEVGGTRWAHPHSRGENELAERAQVSKSGSSPLTRGKPLLRGLLSIVSRLIPTHAGKTDASKPRCCTHGAHPHSRGENIDAAALRESVVGSSPLTRGKPTCSRLRL